MFTLHVMLELMNPTQISGYDFGKFGFGSNSGQSRSNLVDPYLYLGQIWVLKIRVRVRLGQIRADQRYLWFYISFLLNENSSRLSILQIRVTQIRVGFGSTEFGSGQVQICQIRIGSNLSWPESDLFAGSKLWGWEMGGLKRSIKLYRDNGPGLASMKAYRVLVRLMQSFGLGKC